MDPSKVAVARSISLRRPQEQCREFSYNFAVLIWQQHLKKAVERLADPANLRISLGQLTFWCGFAD